MNTHAPKLCSRAQVEQCLDLYESHGLDDLSQASLMDRIDNKFLIPRTLVLKVLEQIRGVFSVLEINGQRYFNYKNCYYDTPLFKLYHDHHNGKLNRYKVRQRTYVDTASSFLEIKFKNNRKRTIKNRISVAQQIGIHNADAQNFLYTQGLAEASHLVRVQNGSYHRVALANEARAERLTLDFDLYFHNPLNSQKTATIHQYVIAELKQSEYCRNSPFFLLMRQYGLRPTPFSKYCMGLYFLGESGRKHNRFKPIHHRVPA